MYTSARVAFRPASPRAEEGGLEHRGIPVETHVQSENGKSSHAGLPQEFKDSIAAVESDLEDNLLLLNSQLGNTQRTLRETLRRLDSLLATWGEQLQTQYQGVDQKYDGVRKQYDNMAQQFEAMQRRYDGVQQQFKGVQHQTESIRKEFEALQQVVQGMQQEHEATRDQCQTLLSFEPRFKGYAETIQGFEQRLAENAAQAAAVSTALQEEGRRRSNVEMSIGGFTQEFSNIRNEDIAKLKGEVDQLRGVVASGQRRQGLAVSVALVALLVAGYVGLGKPGWPVVANQIASWSQR